jgi:YebC/PmpR family DNA-binding regulatory protein
MSGHSKWATIKRQKGANDAKRGQLFTRLGNAIALAAKGGADPEVNFALRLAIDRARAANMPTANVQRSIDRGAGKLGGAIIEEMTFEAYGPDRIGAVIECATDNKNRTVAEVRTAVTKNGGSMAAAGSVLFQFDRKGVVRIKKSGDDDGDQLAAIDAGAEDVFDEDDLWAIYTEPKQLHAVRKALGEAGLSVESAELAYVPKQTVEVSGDAADKVVKFMDALDDLDEVTNTYTNFDIKE